uniref:Uncharacterized protein n=1 Tax=Arundo donax TaxID=35708 RepID=A0A0A9B0T0_ARUDO
MSALPHRAGARANRQSPPTPRSPSPCRRASAAAELPPPPTTRS